MIARALVRFALIAMNLPQATCALRFQVATQMQASSTSLIADPSTRMLGLGVLLEVRLAVVGAYLRMGSRSCLLLRRLQL